MKIILVATNARGKNLVFVSDALRAYVLQDVVRLAKAGDIENIYPVYRATGVYVRTKPSVPQKEQLDWISISSFRLFSSTDDIRHALSTPAFDRYWKIYQRSLKTKNRPFIVIGGHPRITQNDAWEKLRSHRGIVFAAAKKFDVDPDLLGAIIIDEMARMAPFEEIRDALTGQFIGINTSAGIAQVKTDTARGLVQSGYYNPNPNDPKLSKEKIGQTSLSHLYTYVAQPQHSIFFAAARMRKLIDEWKKIIDISKSPDIIATLYSLKGKTPHTNPQPNDRGLQIADEFYPLAEKWLR